MKIFMFFSDIKTTCDQYQMKKPNLSTPFAVKSRRHFHDYVFPHPTFFCSSVDRR